MTGIVKMTTPAVEESTYVLPVTFYDADEVQVTPKSAVWSLYGHDKTTIVNSREDIPLTGSVIVLTGDDLALPVSSQTERRVLIEAVYDSATYGNDLKLKVEIYFKIVNLHTLT
jgi:hypothetical protein